jgi:hypothetical protein
MSNFSEMKEFIDYTFYKMESDVKGFDENLQKFKEELFAYCEQLGFKTEKYVGVHHLVEFTVKDENNRDYDVTLFSFDYKIKNKMSYLYLDDTVRGILKHRKDDMFIYLERNDDTLYNCNLDDKLIEYECIDMGERLQTSIWNILFRLDFIRSLGIEFEQHGFFDDMIFHYRMQPKVKRAVLISDITYLYYKRENFCYIY